MQKKGANISLKGYDDIFSTDQSRAEAQQERVQEIPLSELHPFEGHPFRVVDDEDMMKTVESVRDFGVLTPAIVRPDPDGGYEIISGHRRHRASELAGKETMPVIVRDMDDDAAIILMVDANLQRETILPSERAYAYKMKLDALKHQGARSDLTSAQLGQKSWAVNQVAEQSGDSRVQVQRYIRLTELIPELLDMVDNGQIKFNPAVELSYLAREEQQDFLSARRSSRIIVSKRCSITNTLSICLCPKKLTAYRFIKSSPSGILRSEITNHGTIFIIISLKVKLIKRKFIFSLPTKPSNSYYNNCRKEGQEWPIRSMTILFAIGLPNCEYQRIFLNTR